MPFTWGIYPTLGVQITPEGVYVVRRTHFAGRGGDPLPGAKAHIPLIEGIVTNSRLVDPVALYDVLEAWQSASGVRRGRLYLQLPLGHYTLRTMTVPKVKRRELFRLIATQQRLGNLIPLEDPALAYDVLDALPEQYRVSITAAQRQSVSLYLDVFTALGFHVVGIRHPAYSYVYLLKMAGVPMEAVVLFIVRTQSVDEAVLYDRGIPEFIREMPHRSGEVGEGTIDLSFVERIERFTRTTLHADQRPIELIFLFDTTSTAEAFHSELTMSFPDQRVLKCPERFRSVSIGHWLAGGAVASRTQSPTALFKGDRR